MFADEILGNYEKRYFGAGHKHTNYEVKIGEGYGNAKIIHTGSWSKKRNNILKPHLSTVDGIILSVLYVEKYLESEERFHCLSSMFLCSFEIKSGAHAIEDLREINLVIKSKRIHSEEMYFEVLVENMIVKLKFKKMNIQSNIYKSNTEMNRYNYFSEHLKHIRHNIYGIKTINERIECIVSREKESDIAYKGIESMLSDGMSILEWLIVFSQMGQILAYDIDSINRNDSETLWMKNVKAEMINPYEYKGEIYASGGVTRKKILKMNSKKWRIFEMMGGSDDSNVRFEGKIAHILPNE